MVITTMTSREFNQDASKAKRAASDGPVFITDRGRPAHVLLTIEEYRRLVGREGSIAELLALPGAEDIELPIDKRRISLKVPDLE
ncbi:MAG TPA: type II toxin-antitoxin system prevent-host-death family antitoxin [Gammaproteobacteria bacterium]|nr:type II toxin-antitoxin system prevent-host-death family antitoxin [Gammaproteobacteria bacterium]